MDKTGRKDGHGKKGVSVDWGKREERGPGDRMWKRPNLDDADLIFTD